MKIKLLLFYEVLNKINLDRDTAAFKKLKVRVLQLNSARVPLGHEISF